MHVQSLRECTIVHNVCVISAKPGLWTGLKIDV